MKFIADLHVHSRFSRATARDLDFEHLFMAAQLKGISLLATGDFTHPGWFEEIRKKLTPAEPGLLRLKSDIARECRRRVPPACRGEVRFVLAAEISNIYKKDGKTRKNHNLVYLPGLDEAETFNRRLDRIGNIRSDGRPILGLDARDLLEIVLDTSENGFLVPAHIWTPWFSVLGSKSGFDSIDDCFGDLTAHVFALETGLSSDPDMNRRVSSLDRFTLVSNSDAHSPAKLGREANLLDTEMSFDALRSALKDRDQQRFPGTIEFYPEEGKYHADGHRKCGVRLLPDETRSHGGICPACGKPMTLGVLYRVEELADRAADQAVGVPPFHPLIPLNEILAEILGVGAASKRVAQTYEKLLQKIGPELDILQFKDEAVIDNSGVPLLGEAIRRMRNRRVLIEPGYDGEFGRVRIFDLQERQRLEGQKNLFATAATGGPTSTREAPACQRSGQHRAAATDDNVGGAPMSGTSLREQGLAGEQTPLFAESGGEVVLQGLNAQQTEAVRYTGGPLLILAGPGTGKTRTLTQRMAHLITACGISPARIVAVTFTQKAAAEMSSRLAALLPPNAGMPLVATFHALCLHLLQGAGSGRLQVAEERQRLAVLGDAIELAAAEGPLSASAGVTEQRIMLAKQQILGPQDVLDEVCPLAEQSSFRAVYRHYQRLMEIEGICDFEDLVFQAVLLLESDTPFAKDCRRRFDHILIDEYQDINYGQYRLIRALVGDHAGGLFAIGDPNQSIYGFRGCDAAYFNRFLRDFSGARRVQLTRNYRSSSTILSASSQVIRCLPGAASIHRLFSDVPGDRSVGFLEAASEQAEAVAIGKVIENMVGGLDFHALDSGQLQLDARSPEKGFGDFAVLYRTRQQGLVLAEVFEKAGIPYQMAQPVRNCDERAISSLLALLRIVAGLGTFWDLDAVRDLTVPGIAAKTFKIFKTWGYRNDFSLKTALYQASRLPIAAMSGQRQKRLYEAITYLADISRRAAPLGLCDTLKFLSENTPLQHIFEQADSETLRRCRGALGKIADDSGEEVTRFLQRIALQSESDAYEDKAERVALMTMHAAKGLEFPVVFIAGCENGLIPYLRPGEALDLEEERRLFYVAMTRAERHLYFSFSRKRSVRGRREEREISPFVADIEKSLIRKVEAGYQKKQPKPQVQLALF